MIALLAAACSGGDDDGDAASRSGGTSTSAAAPEDRAAVAARADVLLLNTAATGINIVATDVVLKVSSGDTAYCSGEASDELASHRAALEGAGDAEVRTHAGAALAELDGAIAACARGDGAERVREFLDRYRPRFEALRQRIDRLLSPAG